jgi:hypothetical protein
LPALEEEGAGSLELRLGAGHGGGKLQPDLGKEPERARGREVSSAMGMAACCRAAGGRSRGHRAIAGRGEEGEDCRGAMDRDAMGCWRNQGAIHGKKEELAPMEWESWATLKFLRAGEDSKGEELAARKGWRPWEAPARRRAAAVKKRGACYCA